MIRVQYLKWPESPHYAFASELLGEDEFGRWVGTAKGTPFTGPNLGAYEHDHVLLAPPGAWWTAFWPAAPSELALYVDICGPVSCTDSQITALDLDLDVVQRRTGEIELVDEDEFEEHRLSLGYPAELVEGALTSAREVLEAVRSGREPFATRGPQWLARFTSRPTPAAL